MDFITTHMIEWYVFFSLIFLIFFFFALFHIGKGIEKKILKNIVQHQAGSSGGEFDCQHSYVIS